MMRTTHPLLASAALVVLLFGAAGCSPEEATPVDLDASTTTTNGALAEDDDPNAEARQQVIDLAEQQCIDDPTKDQGVVRIVDNETDEVVNEYVADCDEVRSRSEE